MSCKVLLLDDDDDLRECLAALLASYGCQCFSAGSLAAMKALPTASLDSDIALLDINLGPSVPCGVDAFRWLREQKFRGRIVFLTGHAKSHPLVEEARRIGGVRVLEKPIPTDELLSLMRPAEKEARP